MNVDELIATTNVEPREYQRRIVSTTVDYFNGVDLSCPADSVMIESPTGSGKTVMGLMTARVMQDMHDMNVGWVAMRRNLLSQAERENAEKNLGVNAKFFSMFDKNPPRGLDLLIVDEAQHDSTTSMSTIYNILKPKKILGLSATPFRTDNMKLCFEKVVTDASIYDLIRDGYLSQFDHYNIPNWTPKCVAEAYLRDRDRWGKSLVFFLTHKECHEFQRILRRHRVHAEMVDGASDRETQLRRFESGEIEVIVNSMVLTEGFDEPSLKTVFARDGSKSPTIQMCGRVLRKHDDFPRKQIVQSVQTKFPFSRHADAASTFTWDNDLNRWLALSLTADLQETTGRILHTLANVEVDMPEFLKKKKRVRGRRRAIE